MKTKVVVLDSFMHGRTHYVRNEATTFSKPEAEELEKKGLVRIEGEAAADEGVDDLLGAGKMEPLTSNKMASAPDNKKEPATTHEATKPKAK